jgi:phytoene dehydrogenase-like protein
MSPRRQGAGAQEKAVIIGGGHNGLCAAFYLAAAGFAPVVLEQRTHVGGGAITAEIHAGFRCPVLSHSVLLHADIARAMELERHGAVFLQSHARAFTPSPTGGITIYDDAARTADALRVISAADADAYLGFEGTLRRIASVLAGVLASPPPQVDNPGAGDAWNLLKAARAFRGLGSRDGYRLLQWLPMPIADVLGGRFTSEPLQATIAAPGLSGAMLGPRSAGSTLLLALGDACRQLAGGVPAVRGGPGALTQAMAAAARAAGAEIRTATRVERILTRSGQAVAVVADGSEIPASIVVSTVHPKTTLLRLMDPGELPPGLAVKIGHYRSTGTVAKVNLALRALPAFLGVPATEALEARIHIGPSLDYMERAFDHAKYGEMSAEPWLEVSLPSILDSTLAPPGGHVASIYVHHAPFHLKDGPWAAARERLLDATLRVLERHAPGITASVVASQVITPHDLEHDYGFAGGHIFHGELAPDQLFAMRPVLGYGRYESPIRGLYLAGAGTHPGGFMTGISGRLAAQEIVRGSRS